MGTMAPTTTTPAAVAPEKTNPTNIPAGTVPAEPMVEATVVRVSSSAPPAKAKMPMGKIFTAMLLAVVVGAAVVGGGVFYLAKTGRLGVGATAPVFETHALVLDSMLVNLLGWGWGGLSEGGDHAAGGGAIAGEERTSVA